MSAYEAFANTSPSPHGEADAGLVVELEMPQALALIRTHGVITAFALEERMNFTYDLPYHRITVVGAHL